MTLRSEILVLAAFMSRYFLARKGILWLLLMVGCVESQVAQRQAPSFLPAPSPSPSAVRNEKCYESGQIKIFQVLDHGILAHLCPVNHPSYEPDAFVSCDLTGEIVYMPVKARENDYVDDQKISLPNNKCFTADGTMTYPTKYGKKRVRKIKIVDSITANTQ